MGAVGVGSARKARPPTAPTVAVAALPAGALLSLNARMFKDGDRAFSRCQLFTEALPHGLTGLFRGRLHARQELREWTAAEAAPLYRWSRPSPAVIEALREVDAIGERLRRENPQLAAAWKAAREEMPDYSDPGGGAAIHR